jgi:hypothetical protein
MPEYKRLLHRGPAQIEVTMPEPQVFACQFTTRLATIQLKRRREAVIEYFHKISANFYRARRKLEILIAFRSPCHAAHDTNDSFWPQFSGKLLDTLLGIRTKDDLRKTVAVAEINEETAPMVSAGIHPATKRYFLIEIGSGKFTTGMCT